jgi:hypothetical protein
MEMVICGSCYTLVSEPDKSQAQTCGRCKGDLHPNSESRLRKFVEHGSDPTRKGVKLKDAQAAAAEVLGLLLHERTKLHLHHLGDNCSGCP